jgi:hypothetical protein
VVVIAKQMRMIPAVTINLAIRAGSVCDPAEAPGAMYLLSRVIDRGTAERSAARIAEDLDSRGITLTTSVTRHLFSLACTCLSEDFDSVCALLGDIVMSPTLPEAELAIRKTEVVTAIRQDDDNPAIRAVESLMDLLYPQTSTAAARKGCEVVEQRPGPTLTSARASLQRRRGCREICRWSARETGRPSSAAGRRRLRGRSTCRIRRLRPNAGALSFR